jgi:hypothetical protein
VAAEGATKGSGAPEEEHQPGVEGGDAMRLQLKRAGRDRTAREKIHEER